MTAAPPPPTDPTGPGSALPGPGRRSLLPLVEPHPAVPVVRRDAARNREVLLEAARRLVEERGAAAVTMEAVAAEAGVGKGTVFRRYGSRVGLMAAVLDHSESAWQAAVIAGPPPLGPGAPAYDRLVAFGESRLRTTLVSAELIRAADASGSRSVAAYSFVATHVRYLLGELGVDGDVPMLATALLAPLEIPVLEQQLVGEGFSVERVLAGWRDLLDRVLRR